MSFGTKEFWEGWYQKELEVKPVVEWYIDYNTIRSYLQKYVQPNQDVLITGCGNSTLGNITLLLSLHLAEEMTSDGHSGTLTNIDYSSLVIDFMNQRLDRSKFPNIEYVEVDVTEMSKVAQISIDLNLQHLKRKYDVCFDKGTVDAILTQSNAYQVITSMFEELRKVVKPGGLYIVLTQHLPQEIRGYFEHTLKGRIKAVETIVSKKSIVCISPAQEYSLYIIEL